MITFAGGKCISPFKKVIILIGFTAVSLIIPLESGDFETIKGNILRELAKGSAKEGFFSLPLDYCNLKIITNEDAMYYVVMGHIKV